MFALLLLIQKLLPKELYHMSAKILDNMDEEGDSLLGRQLLRLKFSHTDPDVCRQNYFSSIFVAH